MITAVVRGLNLLLINITASSLLGAAGFLLKTPPPDGFGLPPRRSQESLRSLALTASSGDSTASSLTFG